MALSTADLTVGYAETIVLDGVDLTLPAGRTTGLIGANGSGKSTLLRAMARVLAPKRGVVLLDGEDIHRVPTKTLARRLGLLPQDPQAPPGMSVRELVALGRHPHRKGFGMLGPEDREAIEKALESTAMTALADRPVHALSGGQRQRAWIALALCQQTGVLLLDEPTTFLDIAHQMEVLAVLRSLRGGRTLVVVLHDLLQATRNCDHLVALADGRIVAEGPPEAVLTPAIVKQVFGVDSTIVPDPCTGRPLVIPHPVDAVPGGSGRDDQ